MSEKDGTTFFGYHVVCLIDVLGQKQKLAHWANLPDAGQITPGFVQALKQTVGTVLRFREQFIKFFDQLRQCTIPEKVGSLPKEQQEKFFRHKECKVEVERLSDTFVFYSLIPNSYGDASVTPVYRILATCAMAMLWSLAAKTPVRGAITIGAGAKLEDGWFYVDQGTQYLSPLFDLLLGHRPGFSREQPVGRAYLPDTETPMGTRRRARCPCYLRAAARRWAAKSQLANFMKLSTHSERLLAYLR